VIAAACGDDDGTDGTGGTDGPGNDSGPGRGSAACQDWQDAVCDFAVGECRRLDRATCDDNYKSVTCNSDARASECSNALNSATCTSPPASCDLTDLADPAPAQQACDQLLTRLCGHVVECGMIADVAACRQQVNAGIDCTRAVAHSVRFEDCLDAVETLSCMIVALPDICDDVIKLRP
jgi:hypothetical protein